MSDRALLDANVLVYATVPTAPQYSAAQRVCAGALAGRVDACVTVQTLLELFATVTNAKRVKRPRPADIAWVEVAKYASMLPVLTPPPDLIDRVRALAEPLGIVAQDVFDVQIAATMLANGVSRVYTYDAGVLGRVPGITVVTP